MQARGVAIHQPELLAKVFQALSTESFLPYTPAENKAAQAALSQASKEWLAVSRACGPVQVSIERGSLESAPRWLALRPTVTELALERLHLGSWHGNASNGDLDEQTATGWFRAAVQAVAGRLQVLEVSCGFDVSLHLLPPLPSLKRLSLLWYSGRNGPSGRAPLDCLARLTPQLESLRVDGGWGTYLSRGATVPAGLRELSLAGNIRGLEPALGQLQSLTWGVMETQGGFDLTVHAMDSLSKASNLTSLDLSSPCWPDAILFFNCLASLTSLRDLRIGHAISDAPTYLSPEAYAHVGTHRFVIHDMLGPALERLTRITSLDLSGNDLPELPDSVATMPALRSLDVDMNQLRNLPRGPWPSLDSLSCDSELVHAALAWHAEDPGRPAQHMLCSLTQLTELSAYSFGLSVQERQERKQQVLAVLPQLQSLSV